MTQGIEEQIGALPAIKPKAHLFQIRREMLSGNFVPSADDAALQERESRFNGVRVDIPTDIFFRMANGLVEFSLVYGKREQVDNGFIGDDDFYILADVLGNYFADGFGGCGVNMEHPQISIALANADDNHLFGAWHPATGFSADVGFVDLDSSVEHFLLALNHCRSDAMAEVPSRFVAHSDSTLNLSGRHTFLRFAEQVRREKPFSKRQMRIIEHSTGSDRKLIVTIFAVEELLFRFQSDRRGLAAQATRAFRPAETNEQFAALIFGAEQDIYIN